MSNSVKLQNIIEEMEIQFDESRAFLNIETGEIISLTTEELTAVEDNEPFDHLPEWQQEDRRVAIDVIDNFEKYTELPTKYDVNEYEIMEDFCLRVNEQKMQNTLLKAIKGKGAFRRFKDKIIEYDIEKQWYEFRNDRFKEIAIQWCQDNNLSYVE